MSEASSDFQELLYSSATRNTPTKMLSKNQRTSWPVGDRPSPSPGPSPSASPSDTQPVRVLLLPNCVVAVRAPTLSERLGRKIGGTGTASVPLQPRNVAVKEVDVGRAADSSLWIRAGGGVDVPRMRLMARVAVSMVARETMQGAGHKTHVPRGIQSRSLSTIRTYVYKVNKTETLPEERKREKRHDR